MEPGHQLIVTLGITEEGWLVWIGTEPPIVLRGFDTPIEAWTFAVTVAETDPFPDVAPNLRRWTFEQEPRPARDKRYTYWPPVEFEDNAVEGLEQLTLI